MKLLLVGIQLTMTAVSMLAILFAFHSWALDINNNNSDYDRAFSVGKSYLNFFLLWMFIVLILVCDGEFLFFG